MGDPHARQNGIAAMSEGAYGPSNRAFELVGQHFGAFPSSRPPAAPSGADAEKGRPFELRVVYDDPFVPDEEADPLRGRD